MTENNDKLKPPARRSRPKGHVLGGAKKTAAAPPPPAELTREHLDAEQAHPADTDLAPPFTADSGLSPRLTADPVETPATTHEASATQAPEQVRISAQADGGAGYTSGAPPVASPAEAPPEHLKPLRSPCRALPLHPRMAPPKWPCGRLSRQHKERHSL